MKLSPKVLNDVFNQFKLKLVENLCESCLCSQKSEMCNQKLLYQNIHGLFLSFQSEFLQTVRG